MAVDILPTAIPLDASEHFSRALYPYLSSLIDTYTDGLIGDVKQPLIDALDRATIASAGILKEKHEWLGERVQKWRSQDSQKVLHPTPRTHHHGSAKKNILMLGSGMVAGPAIAKIAEREDVRLLIGIMALFGNREPLTYFQLAIHLKHFEPIKDCLRT